MIELLKSEDLVAERFEALGRAVEARCDWPEPFKPEHFFPTVRGWIELGFCQAWSCENGLLIGLFTSNTFSGEMGGSVLCWWGDGGNQLGLLQAFEAECDKRGCKHRYVSAFGQTRSKAIQRLYRMRGYQPHEQIFVKLT